MPLGARDLRRFSMYRMRPSSSLSWDELNSTRACGPATFAGFEISIGTGRMRPCSSHEMMWHSSFWDIMASAVGVSCSLACGALVFGAGGGSASPPDVLFPSSSSRRCCLSRVSSCSWFLSLSVSFRSLSAMISWPDPSSFRVPCTSFRRFPSRSLPMWHFVFLFCIADSWTWRILSRMCFSRPCACRDPISICFFRSFLSECVVCSVLLLALLCLLLYPPLPLFYPLGSMRAGSASFEGALGMDRWF